MIPHHWLMLSINPVEIPQVLDHVTREPILFITDHYRYRTGSSTWRYQAKSMSMARAREVPHF